MSSTEPASGEPAPNATISICVNDLPIDLPAGASVEQLLAQLGLQRRGLAVEVNGEIVPQRGFGERLLHADDRVEVVSLVGGG